MWNGDVSSSAVPVEAAAVYNNKSFNIPTTYNLQQQVTTLNMTILTAKRVTRIHNTNTGHSPLVVVSFLEEYDSYKYLR